MSSFLLEEAGGEVCDRAPRKSHARLSLWRRPVAATELLSQLYTGLCGEIILIPSHVHIRGLVRRWEEMAGGCRREGHEEVQVMSK